MSKNLKDRQDHIDYIMAKSLRTRKRWDKIMQAKGNFEDDEFSLFNSKESTPIESDTQVSKNTKNTKDIPTTNQNIPRKKHVEKFLSEVFD